MPPEYVGQVAQGQGVHQVGRWGAGSRLHPQQAAPHTQGHTWPHRGCQGGAGAFVGKTQLGPPRSWSSSPGPQRMTTRRELESETSTLAIVSAHSGGVAKQACAFDIAAWIGNSLRTLTPHRTRAPATVLPACPLPLTGSKRMSRGPSREKLNPLPATSKWMELAPKSASSP